MIEWFFYSFYLCGIGGSFKLPSGVSVSSRRLCMQQKTSCYCTGYCSIPEGYSGYQHLQICWRLCLGNNNSYINIYGMELYFYFTDLQITTTFHTECGKSTSRQQHYSHLRKRDWLYTCFIYNTKAFFNGITLNLLPLFTVVPRYFLDRITAYGDAYLCTEAHPFQS